MPTLHSSKISYYIDKLAVASEPGLTNAQLMLVNHDLRPGNRPHFPDVLPLT
jgi:nucleobase:cation symporter-1, NCS1 family